MVMGDGHRVELTAGVDHYDVAPIIGRQWYTYDTTHPEGENHPRWQWLNARGYSPTTDVHLCPHHPLTCLVPACLPRITAPARHHCAFDLPRGTASTIASDCGRTSESQTSPTI